MKVLSCLFNCFTIFFNICEVLSIIFWYELAVKRRYADAQYALGLIYDVEVSEDCDVIITMTLTSPNCPVAETLPIEVEEKVKVIPAVKNVKVTIVFEPTWTKEMMSEEAKLELGML